MRSSHLRAHLPSAAGIATSRGPVVAGRRPAVPPRSAHRRYVATTANAGIEAPIEAPCPEVRIG